MKYIDIHGHLNFDVYDSDRDAVIKRAKEAGVGIVCVGVDMASSKEAIDLAQAHDNVWAMVGLHPTNTSESLPDKDEFSSSVVSRRPGQSFDALAFRELTKHPKVIGIGECGLDFFHARVGEVEIQRSVFIEHIKLAMEANKPLMLHVRDGRRQRKSPGGDSDGHKTRSTDSAYLEAVRILKEYPEVKVNFHFFAGDEADMEAAMSIGANFSFTGVITFTKDYDFLIKRLPIDRIMSETDCPYVAPVPFRGKRCEPVHVIEVVKAIARIRGEDEDYVRQQILSNAQRVFF